MKKMLVLAGVVTAVASITVSVTAAATPQNITCNGTLGPTVVAANIVVRNNAVCRLNGTTVLGNIQIMRGGALRTGAHAQFGSLQAVSPKWLRIEDASIGGSLQISKTSGNPPRFSTDFFFPLFPPNLICRTYIGGALQMSGNLAPYAVGDADWCDQGLGGGNYIEGSAQFVGNKAPIEVWDNTIVANLQCAGKNQPLAGDGNEVGGVDQCDAIDSVPIP